MLSMPPPFHTQVSGYHGPRLRFAVLRFSAHTTSSSQAGVLETPRLLVSLHKEGVALVQQGGRESRIESGDLFIIDPSRPFCIETGDILTHSIYLEPEPLRALVPGIDAMTVRAIRTADGPGALFRGLVDELFALGDALREDTAERMADALPHVLAAALTALDAGLVANAVQRRQLLKQRIDGFVRENLRRHDLDAAVIASGVGLSARYVYEVLADEAQPLMKWIWNLRLERCRADLETFSLKARPVGEIAHYWGFNDVAHFSRSFKQRYGSTPREHRAQSGAARG